MLKILLLIRFRHLFSIVGILGYHFRLRTIGRDDESNVCIMMGVLHFFVPVNLPAPIYNRAYLACGRVASVNDKTNVGEDAGDIFY